MKFRGKRIKTKYLIFTPDGGTWANGTRPTYKCVSYHNTIKQALRAYGNNPQYILRYNVNYGQARDGACSSESIVLIGLNKRVYTEHFKNYRVSLNTVRRHLLLNHVL